MSNFSWCFEGVTAVGILTWTPNACACAWVPVCMLGKESHLFIDSSIHTLPSTISQDYVHTNEVLPQPYTALLQLPSSPWCRRNPREWWVSPARAGWPRPAALPPSLWLPRWWNPHQLFLRRTGRSATPADYTRSPKGLHDSKWIVMQTYCIYQMTKRSKHSHVPHRLIWPKREGSLILEKWFQPGSKLQLWKRVG